MTIIEFILIIIAVLMMLAGVALFMRGIKSSDVGNAQQKLPEGIQQKDGLPVLPRQMREFEEPQLDSEIEQEQLSESVSDAIDEQNIDESINTTEQSTATFDERSVETVDTIDEAYKAESTQEVNSDEAAATAVQYEPVYFPDVPTDDIADDTVLKSHEAEILGNVPQVDSAIEDVELDIQQNIANEHNHDVYAETSIPLAAATVAHMAQTNSDNTGLENTQPELTNKIEQDTNSMPEQAEVSDMTNNNNQALDEQLKTDNEIKQNSPLHNAEFNLNISILPNNEFEKFGGIQLLKLADNYGFKFGEMNMFHRYQEKDGSGLLWFSMMGLGIDGVKPFDLNTLANDEFKGLILFLPLPHPKVFQGFDSMMSIASLMARELDGYIVDEHSVPINSNYKKKLRAQLEEVYGE